MLLIPRKKLTVDAKCELTIDPRTVGLSGTDELTLKSIATRESYLTQFPWPTAAAQETALFEIQVTPALWNATVTSTETEMFLPACGFAALPFRNWIGSMKFRFQVVASNYHKGRFKIVYDPHGFSSNEYVTNYTYIVDLAEEKDVTMSIGWGSEEPYCICGFPGNGANGATPLSLPFSNNPSVNVPGPTANGLIRVYVVNELVTPNSIVNNDVLVNVWVSAGDDMEFRNPTENLENYSWKRQPDVAQFTAQMGEEVQADVEDTSEPSKPVAQTPDIQVLQKQAVANPYSHVFFGEEIVSFRQMLKRYCLHCRHSLTEHGGDIGLWTLTQSIFPFYRGWVSGGIYNTTTPVASNYSFGKMTLINYITPAFVCWRGGLKWKINQVASDYVWRNKLEVARKANIGTFLSQFQTWIVSSNFASDRFLNTSSLSSVPGMAASPAQTAPSIEVETPLYANVRFIPAKKINYTTQAAFNPVFSAQTEVYPGTATEPITFDCYVAGAEDFSLYFYTGPPRIYYQVAVPTA
jgi:hypothetical protein